MLSISHAVTGAFIAVSIPDPRISIPLILVSHYLEDAVPHWDVGTGLSSGKKSVKDALMHEIPDLLFAGILVLLFFPLSYQLFPLTPHLGDPQIYGAFFGLLPDFLEAPRNFLKKEPWYLRAINRFHQSFHHSIPHILAGLLPQIILLTTLWFLR